MAEWSPFNGKHCPISVTDLFADLLVDLFAHLLADSVNSPTYQQYEFVEIFRTLDR